MSYILTTDATCDLPDELVPEGELCVFPMSYTLDGKEYSGRPGERLEPDEFYAKMRAGSMPQTVQINTMEAESLFEQLVSQGSDVLHLNFSSALSGTCNSARMAADALNEKYGRCCVTVVDTLCASLGEGLLVTLALEKKRQGAGLEETRDYVESLKLHLCHYFTVNDLFHLHRGGRVSIAAAIVGSMLGIKPVLHVDDEGRLVPIGKVRGRRQSLDALVEQMAAHVGNWENPSVFISHGGCREDADYVAGLVKKRFSPQKIVIGGIGPVIGSHSGPGTVALFFLGEKR